MAHPRPSLLRRAFSWRGLFAANLVLAVLVGVSFGREWMRQRELRADIAALQAQGDALAARELELFSLSASLRTESFIEGEARLKLGLKRPGEQVVVVRGTGPAAAADPGGAPLPSGTREAVANPTKWWYYYFDKNAYERLASDAGTDAR